MNIKHNVLINHIFTTKKLNLTLYKNDQISDWSKLKAFADNKCNLKIKILGERVENIMGEKDLFPQCFQKVFHTGSLKVGIVW